MNRRKALIALIVTAVIAVGVLIYLGPETTNSRNVVHIAANLPLTGSLAVYGKSVQEGASMALDEMRSRADGSPVLDVDWQDNAGDPQKAVSIMQQQLLKPVDIYTAGVKPQAMAIADQVSAKGLPNFLWIFDAYINKHSTNNFRTWVSYKIEPPMFLSYAKDVHATRVAIIYVQLPHTVEEFEQMVVPGLKAEGVSSLFVEPFEFGKRDFKDVAVKVQAFNPDLIILNGFQADLVGLVRALEPMGLIKDGNTIATYDMLDAAEILGKDETEGIRVVTPLFISRPDTKRIAEWRQHFQALYGKPPLYTDAFAYDMISIIRDASTRLKLPATSPEWSQSLRQTDIQGITGPLKFDADGDLLTPLEIAVFRAGKVMPLNGKEAF